MDRKSLNHEYSNMVFGNVDPEVRDISTTLVEGDVCNFPTQEARDLPNDTHSIFVVQNEKGTETVQIMKTGRNLLYEEVVRLAVVGNQKVYLQTYVYGIDKLKSAYPDAPFIKEITTTTSRVIGMEMFTRCNGEPNLAFVAKKFPAWSLDVMSTKRVTHILTAWEPDSDLHRQYCEALIENHGNVSKAIKKTWSYLPYRELGFKPTPSVLGRESLGGKVSPYGFGTRTINVLYRRG